MARPGTPLALRLRILEALRQHPGLTATDLALQLAVHHSTAGYHLARLERRGVVVRLRHRGRVHAFLAGVHAPRDRAQAVLARSASSAEVLARVGPAPQRLGPIAAGLPITKAAVYWHLQRLAALGLVHVEGPPRGRTYRLPATTMLPVQPAAPVFNPVPVAG